MRSELYAAETRSMGKWAKWSLWLCLACGGTDDAPPQERAVEEVDPAGQELIFWYQHTLAREDRLREMITEFNAANPHGISVRGEYAGSYSDIYNKMTVGIQSGLLPDLVVAYNNQATVYIENGGAVDLLPYMDSPRWGLTTEALADFYAPFLAQDRYGAVQAALAPNRSLELLYYNTDWLAELGYAEPPADWRTFSAMCRAARDQPFRKNATGRSLGWILAADASHLASMVFGLGGDYMDPTWEQYTLDTPQLREALELLHGLAAEEAVELAVESGQSLRDFSVGEVLFIVSSSTGIPHVESAVAAGLDFAWQIAPLPHTGSVPAPNIYGASVAICRTTPERQLAAWLFLKWFTEPVQQARWVEVSGYFPARRSTREALDDYFAAHPRYARAFEWLDFGCIEPGVPGYTRVRRLIAEAMVATVAGEDLDATLAELQRTAQATRGAFK